MIMVENATVYGGINALLWLLTIVGAWNAINMAGRIYYKAPWWPYAYRHGKGLPVIAYNEAQNL